MEQVAFLGDSKQINLWNADGHSLKQVTYPLAEGEKTPCLWPTWSKDGQWLAYFQPLQKNIPARLCIAQVNGVDMAVLAEFTDRQPIYMHWSPTGKHLAVVEQSPEGLELVVYPINGSRSIPIDDGAPIFFQWLPDGTGLVAHVVHPIRQTSRVQFYSLEDSNSDWVISEDSGGFCAPVFLDDRFLFAEQLAGQTHLKAFCLETEENNTLCVLDGVMSIQPRPNHSQIAIGLSGGQPGMQKGVQLLTSRQDNLKPLPKIPMNDWFGNRCFGRQMARSCSFQRSMDHSVGLSGSFGMRRDSILSISFFQPESRYSFCISLSSLCTVIRLCLQIQRTFTFPVTRHRVSDWICQHDRGSLEGSL